MKFELTNKDRKYLGLEPLESHWELYQLPNGIRLYFDGNIIKRQIYMTDTVYKENQMQEETDEDRVFLLPKTNRGKPKKLNYTSIQKRNGHGVYFNFGKYVTIGNVTSQKTFYSSYFQQIEIKDFTALRKWLDKFIAETTPKNLKTLEIFKTEKRQHTKYKEGDFFSFKVGRNQYGFGRIICDVIKLRKDKTFKTKRHLGLNTVMARPLVIKVYHKISDTKEIDFEELRALNNFPPQYIMDNNFFYGEYEIIGNRPLEAQEYDFVISCGQSTHYTDETTYFQWGLIYIEEAKQTDKNKAFTDGTYRDDGIGANLDITVPVLKKCILSKSNQPYWDSRHHYKIKGGIRNPENEKIKKKMFKYYGLNPNENYADNLENFQKKESKKNT